MYSVVMQIKFGSEIGLLESELLVSPTLKPCFTKHTQVKMYLNKMEREGMARVSHYHVYTPHLSFLSKVRMFLVVTLAYLIFWGPLFTVSCCCFQHIL